MKLLFSLIFIIILLSNCNAININKNNDNDKSSQTSQSPSCAYKVNNLLGWKSTFSYVGLNNTNPFKYESSTGTLSETSFFINGEICVDRVEQSLVVNYNYNFKGGDIITWIFTSNNTQYTYYQNSNKCTLKYFNGDFPSPYYTSGGPTTVGQVKAESLVSKVPNEFGATILTVDSELCSPVSITDYNPNYLQVSFDEYEPNCPSDYFTLLQQCNNPTIINDDNDFLYNKFNLLF